MRKLILLLTLLASPALSENYSQQVDCLARNIYFESRGEPIDGQYAVAFVTLNRVEDERWPDSICEVVYQPSQFSWTVNPDRPIREQDSWQAATTVARDAIVQYYEFGEDITDGAVFFNKGPRQAYHEEHKVSIGQHNFYS